MDQARDRFQGGVANNIEVIQAQDSLSRANDNQIAALPASTGARDFCAVDRADGKSLLEVRGTMSSEGSKSGWKNASKRPLVEDMPLKGSAKGVSKPEVRRLAILGGRYC